MRIPSVDRASRASSSSRRCRALFTRSTATGRWRRIPGERSTTCGRSGTDAKRAASYGRRRSCHRYAATRSGIATSATSAYGFEKLTGDLGDKKEWRAYKARVKALPAAYRTAAEGVEKYLMYTGNVSDGKKLIAMCHDLADLFERAATYGTPVRDIVGEDPAEFVDAFAANYSDGGWVAKQQQKLADAIDTAEREEKP